MSDSDTQENRRPLKVRGAVTSQRFARWLSQKNITPNQISIMSVIFAIMAATCLACLRLVGPIGQWLLPIGAAALIQCRLLCNLFDGMVAVEGGKGTASGELFNDIPDRIADPVILVAAGYATTVLTGSVPLGWCAGLMAVMTAYVRTLSTAIGAPVDFRGPMAKQHRMALMTIACMATAAEGLFQERGYIMAGVLAVIILGCVMTVWRRALAAFQFLEKRDVT